MIAHQATSLPPGASPPYVTPPLIQRSVVLLSYAHAAALTKSLAVPS